MNKSSTGDSLTPKQIRRLFRKHGYRQAAFCEEYGYKRSAVSMFLSGRSTSRPMYERALAKAQELESRAQQKQSEAA